MFKYFLYIQNQIFPRHYVKKLMKNDDKSKYSILYTPNLKPFSIQVSKQFLFWDRNFENFIKGVTCQSYHYGPNY